MSNGLTEKRFEEHITDCLAGSAMYCQRQHQDFDIKNMCDRGELLRFMKAQTKVWAKLTKEFGEGALDEVVRVYNSTLDNQGMLHVLKKGIKIKGTEVRFVAFRDEMAPEGREPDLLYKANRFAVVRQMRYSLDKKDSQNSIDLVILINGLPIITAELKNEFTDQNYTHSIMQYRKDRNPDNRFLRSCLVHFAVDNNYAFMTTRLKGDDTHFLPFNQDSVNPAPHVVQHILRKLLRFGIRQILLQPLGVQRRLVHAHQANGAEVVREGPQVTSGVGIQALVHEARDDLTLDAQGSGRDVHVAVEHVATT